MRLSNLKHEADKIRLTEAEKAAMRASIFGVASPTTSSASPYFFFNLQFVRTHAFVPLALALVVLVGSGTAYAAEGALPGDTLYPVKIYVNEEVVQAFAKSPVKKAEVHATLAERRVVEAQTLAAEGRLDATVTEALAINLENHVEVAEAEADKADEEESGKGREVRAKLTATLETGGAILARLGKDSDTDTKKNSEGLAVRVIARAEVGTGRDTRAFAKAAATADASSSTEAMSLTVGATALAEDPAVQKVAASLQLKAAAALKDTHALFVDVQKSLNATTTAQIEREFSSIETSMSLGAASLGADQYNQAEADFMAALRLATKLNALLKAHQKFDGNLISPLLDEAKLDHNDDEGDEHTDPTEVDANIKIDLRGGLPIKVLE